MDKYLATKVNSQEELDRIDRATGNNHTQHAIGNYAAIDFRYEGRRGAGWSDFSGDRNSYELVVVDHDTFIACSLLHKFPEELGIKVTPPEVTIKLRGTAFLTIKKDGTARLLADDGLCEYVMSHETLLEALDPVTQVRDQHSGSWGVTVTPERIDIGCFSFDKDAIEKTLNAIKEFAQ